MPAVRRDAVSDPTKILEFLRRMAENSGDGYASTTLAQIETLEGVLRDLAAARQALEDSNSLFSALLPEWKRQACRGCGGKLVAPEFCGDCNTPCFPYPDPAAPPAAPGVAGECFIGPCVHGRDPFERCGICSGLSPYLAKHFAREMLLVADVASRWNDAIEEADLHAQEDAPGPNWLVAFYTALGLPADVAAEDDSTEVA